MKKQLLLAAVAGLTLVSTAPPADPIPWEDEESLSSYPTCSATVTDRCIQGNARGAARRDSAARNDAAGNASDQGRGGPAEPAGAKDVKYAAGDYPPCSSTVTDRCIQTRGSGRQAASQRMARTAPKARTSTPMRLAMRAGERG